MKFSFRELFILTLCMFLAGCMVKVGGNNEDGDIQYYPPGPEFKQSHQAERTKSPAADQLPHPLPLAPSPPQR